MTAAQPQQVLAPPTAAAVFLVVTINDRGEAGLQDVIGNLSGLTRSVGFRVPEKHLSMVTSFGSEAWGRLFSGPRPQHLRPFPDLTGERHNAPATPGDVLFHIRGESIDVCFELANQLVKQLGDSVTIVDEVHGFRFFDNRDLLGFVDGTENPEGSAAIGAVLVADDPNFVGGSYVHVQKYRHDLTAWDQLPVEQQEQAIGRTKLGDIELADSAKAPNAHNVLNVIEDENGEQLQILRLNMAFGNIQAKEFGTYFCGYARDPGVTERMLRNMFLGDPPGTTDRILDFSTAVTGCAFFAPTVDFLDDPPLAAAPN